jgi:hypothetical protein
VTAILGWLLAVAFGAGGTWAVWKRTLDKGQARKDVQSELTQMGKEAKTREAQKYAAPRPNSWDDTVDRL